MATLMMSAAVPCTLALKAILSPSFRTFLLEFLSSGTYRRLPKRVVAYPSSSASSSVSCINSVTLG